MRRQPQVGPRKYKRRRKLKPHELELMSNNLEEADEEGEDELTDSEDERKRRLQKKPKKPLTPKSNVDVTYADVYNSFSSAIENISSIVNSKTTPKEKKKLKKAEVSVPSRPKMIHTQKTKVTVETGEGGKVRHKTKTMITRTQPTELKSATGERIRPRTKNVSYHILHPEKLPLATFPEDDAAQAVSNLLASDMGHTQSNGVDHGGSVSQSSNTSDTNLSSSNAEEQGDDIPTLIKVTQSPVKVKNNSLGPGRHIIGPGTKVVRIVKGGMIVSKKKKEEPEKNENVIIKQEIIDPVIVKQENVDPSPLHELAEISMQHAQNLFKCEMCSEVFSDRAQLLVHVPIHI